MMNSQKNKLHRSTVASILLTAPFIYFFIFMLLGFDPGQGKIYGFLDGEANRTGSLIILGLILMLLGGFYISLFSVARTRKLGLRITSNPVNLAVLLITSCIILACIGLVIEDQLPCWLGVPNCD